MSQNLASLVALSRSFGPGRDMFDAPEDAFHAVIDAIREELAPTSILMFLTIESLIRSLKNQRRPAVHSIHDSRWQRDRASGERLMCRMMTQLIKLTQPPKGPRAVKAAPKKPADLIPTLHEPTPGAPAPVALVEPIPPVIISMPEPAAEPTPHEPTPDAPALVPLAEPVLPIIIPMPEPMPELAAETIEPVAKVEAADSEPVDNAPAANPEPDDQDQEQEAKIVFASDGTYKIIGTPRRGPSPSEIFKRKLKNYKPKQEGSPTDAPLDRNGTPFS